MRYFSHKLQKLAVSVLLSKDELRGRHSGGLGVQSRPAATLVFFCMVGGGGEK